MQSEADIALGMDHIQRRLARLYKQAYKVKCFFSLLLIKIQHAGRKPQCFGWLCLSVADPEPDS